MRPGRNPHGEKTYRLITQATGYGLHVILVNIGRAMGWSANFGRMYARSGPVTPGGPSHRQMLAKGPNPVNSGF